MSCSGGKNNNLNNIKMKSAILGLINALTLVVLMWMYYHDEPIHNIFYVVTIMNTILFASVEIQEEIRKRK